MAVLLAATFGCGGGSSGGGTSSSLSGICGGSKSFCVASCNLGCTGTGCTMTDIAVNQMLIFRFNNDVDPTSVNSDTFSIKTAAGTSPTGKFVVNGATIFFVPEIREVGKQTFFGFQKGETYTIFLPAGPKAPKSLRSTAGIALQRPLICTVRVSKDVIDLDGKPPEARMVVPSKTTGVDNRTQIVLEFSEYIIPSTALNPDAVRIVVYQKDPATGMQVPAKREVQVDQLRNWAQLTLTPKVVLPGDINVMVTLEAVIRDLSGKTLRPKSFYFRTAKTNVRPEPITENFDDNSKMDRARTGAVWSGGFLRAGRIGGSGILGDFDYRVGSKKVGNAYVFDTDNTVIPASSTLDGAEHQITDGVFEFATFRIPAGVTVRFEGTHPVKIFVRGSVNVEGTLDVSGRTTTEVAKWDSITKQKGVVGGKGGPGGGNGGDGGSEPGSGGTPEGKNGQDMPVPAGHPRKGQEVGTGGRGSYEHPRNLDPKQVKLGYYTVSSIQVSYPGGGGGSATPGGLGKLKQLSLTATHGAPVPASKGFSFLPLDPQKSTLLQLLVGGAGGGGAGVCPWGSFSTTSPTWNRGNGGGGGGGAVALRAGGNLTVQSTAALLAKGAVGGGAGALAASGLAPGGGGGGGSILLQAGGAVLVNGMVDVRGGASLVSNDLYSTVQMTSAPGGDGYYRAEADPAPAATVFSKAFPAPSSANVGKLTDSDPVTGAQSKWYSTKRIFPKFKYYEIEAVVGGNRVLFTDNPAHPNPCVFGKTPVAFFIQGAQVDEKQQIVETSITWWVKSIGDLVDPNKNGGVGVPQVFRWVVLLDKRFSGGGEIRIDRVSVVVSD